MILRISDVPTYACEADTETEARSCRASAMQPAVAALLGEAIITHAKGNTPDAIRMIMEVIREGASPWRSRLARSMLQRRKRPTPIATCRPCTATAARRPSDWSLPGWPRSSTRWFLARNFRPHLQGDAGRHVGAARTRMARAAASAEGALLLRPRCVARKRRAHRFRAAIKREPTVYPHYARKMRLLRMSGNTKGVMEVRLTAARHLKHCTPWAWYEAYVTSIAQVRPILRSPGLGEFSFLRCVHTDVFPGYLDARRTRARRMTSGAA